MKTLLLSLIILVLLSTPAISQQVLTGQVKQKNTDAILASVTVVNHTQKRYNISDVGGNYRIVASPGDTLIFSSIGYHSDTTRVVVSELEHGYIVHLEPNMVELPSVLVGQSSNYQLDSVKRKEDYAWLDHVHKVRLAGDQTPTDGIGIGLSPITYFSKRQRNLRRLRKQVISEEKDFYIDSRFPPSYVSMLTGLRGDSLRLFLVAYRPTYTFCRGASNEDILLYISEKLKLFQGIYLEHPMFAVKQN